MNPYNTEAPTDLVVRRTAIATVVYAALARGGIAMTQDPEAADQLHQQIVDILAEVDDSLDAAGADRVGERPRALSVAIGRSRARNAVHPSTSLEAASRIFEVALPLLLEDLRNRVEVTDPTTVVSRALHRAIMARVAPAAVGYVETLLEKLSIAQHEERLRLSRELHDHVAHNVAAAMQRIVLTRSTAATTIGDEATEYLTVAEGLLRSALADTRTIGVELRQTVGDRSLDEAVHEYVERNPTLRSLVQVRTSGEPVRLPTSTGEEVYVIIREAIRNAVTHAQATTISVQLTWTARGMRVAVVDDGAGFRLDNHPSASMGLLAMQERAEAIGADLVVTSLLGEGTTVTIVIDHERGFR